MDNKFISAAAQAFGSKMPKGNKIMSVKLNHRNGSALVMVSFSRDNQLKQITRKLYLNPEIYPDAIRVDGKDLYLK